MNVLSLFDGIACGKVALDRAGIKYAKYFASDIDKYAIQVAIKNHPDIIHLGDVKQVKGEDLPKIDLFIGGSPCQGFSFAGKRLNFEDPRSKLFFEYVRLLKECKPKYFLLENVKMKKEYQEVITNLLGVQPVEINSSLLTAQSRKRLYWTNIPLQSIVDKGELFEDIVDYEKPVREKSQTIPATIYKENAKSMIKRKKWGLLVNDNNVLRKVSPLECERLQGVDDNYTDCVSNTQRYRMIGNGWTVPVIEHIFGGLKTI